MDKWFTLENEPANVKGRKDSQPGQLHLIITNGGPLAPEDTFSSFIRQADLSEHYMVDTYYTLGEGSFGVVYKGRSMDGREVAVKKLFKNKLDHQNAELLETEVRLMKRLKHPHVVEFIDVFEDKGKSKRKQKHTKRSHSSNFHQQRT